MIIRDMTRDDFEQFWDCFKSIIAVQETYAYPPDMSFEQSYQLWCELPAKTFVCEENGVILGSYYIKANAMGPGAHVCNCGYMVSPAARGKGVATALCLHSQQIGKQLGFRAMQFNAVVSTNTTAVNLWQKLGFQILATLPEAYRHRTLGYVDTYLMYKKLDS